MQIVNISMVMLPQKNFTRAVAFYHKIGLQCVALHNNEWAEFTVGKSRIGLYATDDDETKKHSGLVLSVDDIEKHYQFLKQESMTVTEPKKGGNGTVLSFVDPGGNTIDLFEPVARSCAKGAGCCKNKG